MSNSFAQQHGWDIDVTINGQSIPKSMIASDIVIEKASNSASLCDFEVLLPSTTDPIDFIDSIEGKDVVINYYTTGHFDRLFTGKVIYPSIDLIQQRITIKCSQKVDELIKAQLATEVKKIGRYSKEVLGDFQDTVEELNARLQTIPGDVDFDSYNKYNINSWYAAASPDYTLDDDDVYYRNPQVVWQNRDNILNTIIVAASYQYTRLYHYQRVFSWTAPYANGNACIALVNNYSLTSVDAIETAIDNAGWRVIGDITFAGLGDPGPYQCFDQGGGQFFWANVQNAGAFEGTFDQFGNVITDADGNAKYVFEKSSTRDLSSVYTSAANWSAAYRFSQFIEEDFPITVRSTQSQTQFGNIDENREYQFREDFDAGQWENYKADTDQPSNAVSLSSGSYYVNETNDVAGFNNMMLCLIDKAKVDILATHRDTTVNCEVPLMPRLELRHTVAINTRKVVCTGKVSSIIHTINLEKADNKTDIEVQLFKSKSSGVTTATSVPTRPTDTLTISAQEVVLGNYFGQEPTDAMNGMIGNLTPNPLVRCPEGSIDLCPVATPLIQQGGSWYYYNFAAAQTTFDEEFRVDTPAIPDHLRKIRPLTAASATYNISIPNDTLEIYFDE